jgi:polysaccharide deacetylase 2 family uncharacterized protein YibQ
MTAKNAQSVARVRQKQRNFLLILSGSCALALAALIFLDSRFIASASRDKDGAVLAVHMKTNQFPNRSVDIMQRLIDRPGLALRGYDALARPPVMEFDMTGNEAGFRSALALALSESGVRLLSWGDGGARNRLRISLGRKEPEIILLVRLVTESHVKHAHSSNTKLEVQPQPKAQAQPLVSRRPRIALVLDDAGGDAALQWLFIELPVKLNFAVIPGLANSHRFAERAKAAGHEVLIHLPMQPLASEKQVWNGSMLAPGMTSREIERILDGAQRSVPGAVAMNNHMGSLATADRALMRMLMPAIKRRGLIFFDSVTHASSVAAEEAGRVGMPVLKRDIFLDHVQDPAYIENALRSLVKLAAGKDFALGIGHVTCMETWQVLRDSLKKYREIGVDFVGITELD